MKEEIDTPQNQQMMSQENMHWDSLQQDSLQQDSLQQDSLQQEHRLSIKEMSESDRPRERMREHGAEVLSNAELFAILIGSGNSKETAVQLMQRILMDCGNNLNNLGKMSIESLMNYKGVGEAKAVTIAVACEIARRRQLEKAEVRADLSSALAIYEMMHPLLRDKDVEEAWVLLMNQKFRLIKRVCISRGGISETAVDIRIVMREALLSNATIIAFCHNHPSGSPQPSRDDHYLTERLAAACKTMRIFFADHVIIGEETYYSYREEGRL